MKRIFISLILAGLPVVAQAEMKPDPIAPFVKKMQDGVADLQKAAAAEIQKAREPIRKPEAAKPKAPPRKASVTPKKTPELTKKPPSEKPAIVSKPEDEIYGLPPVDDPIPEKSMAAKTPPPAPAGTLTPVKPKVEHGQPALISTADLADFETLPSDRKRLIESAIAVARDSPWLPYQFGGSSPSDGGFDCSGAMCYVMGKAGLKPPRTSANQYTWLKDNQRLHEVPEDVREIDHPSLAALHPGDLLFWSGTYTPTDGRVENITHVAMYLGKEKKGGRPVMINATDGRSYHGKQANGYGVYDFYLPKDGSKSKFVGYGSPIGIAEMPAPVIPAK